MTTTTDQLANIPHPAGATWVKDWYGTDSPDAARYFTGGSWVAERNDRDSDFTVAIDGTQHAADGRVDRFIRVDEGNYERLTEMTGADARALGRALIAAADEFDAMGTYDSIT